jgi:hypothetical protein
LKRGNLNHLLVGPVVIGAGLGREITVRSPATAIGRGMEPLDARTDPQIKLGGPVGRILVVKKRKRGNPKNVYKEWSPSPYKLVL